MKFYNYIKEDKPISKESSLKFVFKLPIEGEFTAEFEDGTKTTITVDKEDKSSGKYAFIGKDKGNIFKTWDKPPSKEEAYEVLKRVKYYGSK